MVFFHWLTGSELKIYFVAWDGLAAVGCNYAKTPQVHPCRLSATIHGGRSFAPLQPTTAANTVQHAASEAAEGKATAARHSRATPLNQHVVFWG